MLSSATCVTLFRWLTTIHRLSQWWASSWSRSLQDVFKKGFSRYGFVVVSKKFPHDFCQLTVGSNLGLQLSQCILSLMFCLFLIFSSRRDWLQYEMKFLEWSLQWNIAAIQVFTLYFQCSAGHTCTAYTCSRTTDVDDCAQERSYEDRGWMFVYPGCHQHRP